MTLVSGGAGVSGTVSGTQPWGAWLLEIAVKLLLEIKDEREGDSKREAAGSWDSGRSTEQQLGGVQEK